jgi:phage FluMu protein gp41
MKRSREGAEVVQGYDLRSRVLYSLRKYVSPLMYDTISEHSTRDLMNLLAQVQSVAEEDADEAGSG